MVDTSNYSGAPITIPQGDGSSKVYDAGLLCPEAQQAVNMLAFLNQFRQVLNAANQVFSNVVNNNLIEEAIVEETKSEVKDNTTRNEDTKE